MIQGIDYSTNEPTEAELQAASIKFACRYTGYTAPGLSQSKILTLAEARDLTAKGLSIVSNFEWYNNRPNEGFAAGKADAYTAMQYHAAAGGPSTAPIYFSVDYQPTDLIAVGEYFKGIASVMPLDRIGVYGSYIVVQYLANNALAAWFWQTYAWSTDASGTYWYTGNHIEQYRNSAVLTDGTVVDLDRALVGVFGQWSTQGEPNYMEAQFNAVWYNPKSGVPEGYQSGIYKVVLEGFLAHKYSACFPTSDEITKGMTDWLGNPTTYQTLSNGHHAEYANGVCRIFDPEGTLVFVGSI